MQVLTALTALALIALAALAALALVVLALVVLALVVLALVVFNFCCSLRRRSSPQLQANGRPGSRPSNTVSPASFFEGMRKTGTTVWPAGNERCSGSALPLLTLLAITLLTNTLTLLTLTLALWRAGWTRWHTSEDIRQAKG